MNAPTACERLQWPPLHEWLLGWLAPEGESDGSAAADWLRARRGHDAAPAALAAWLQAAPPHGHALAALVGHAGLNLVEAMALSLASAVEVDAAVARAIAWLQAPLAAGARPTVGLVARLASALGVPDAPAALAHGSAWRWHWLQAAQAGAPWSETALCLPLPLALALQSSGHVQAHWPGLRAHVLEAPGASAPSGASGAPDAAGGWPLGEAVEAEARRQARALQVQMQRHAPSPLVVRAHLRTEAEAACALIAQASGRRVVFVDGTPPDGLAAWAWLEGVLPVLCHDGAPGETWALPALPGHSGPLLVATGLDGQVQHAGASPPAWTLPLPDEAQRAALWRRQLGPDQEAFAQRLARDHRGGASAIAAHAREAGRGARLLGREQPDAQDWQRALRHAEPQALGTLAQAVPDDVDDEALVVTPALRDELQALLWRCQQREGLGDALGPAARTRYRPGVRALFVGPSGTGKTLAASWLATRLGLPLHRIDIAAVSSKYIGETEKNLASVFARAEHAQGVLLFDEADALFGQRTEVRDANDRFANQQTNYLLQRLEAFDGIALLTSNARSRFDSAFTRRLDAIVEFSLPGPAERLRLWQAHLGTQHALDPAQLNRIAAACELAGGHVRNATLAAAARAKARGTPLHVGDVARALAAEYRKLGRPMPADLQRLPSGLSPSGASGPSGPEGT